MKQSTIIDECELLIHKVIVNRLFLSYIYVCTNLLLYRQLNLLSYVDYITIENFIKQLQFILCKYEPHNDQVLIVLMGAG